MNKHNLIKLRSAARNKRIIGGLSYELAILGDRKYLEVFYDSFKDSLFMQYPCTDVEGIHINDGEIVIWIISFQETRELETRRDEREEIINFIHDTLTQDVWHGSWIVAIGRS